jgi:hypothetical protein
MIVVIKKKREINKGRGESRNKENLAKLEAYIKLHDTQSTIYNNRELRSES